MPANKSIPGAAILGCAGTSLSTWEREFFSRTNPLGFILFARNVDNPHQVRQLTADLRACVGRPDAPVLIDQEGGRVQRLRPPHWRTAPPGRVFADLAASDEGRAAELLRLNFRLIGRELAQLGIDVDCAPVLDVPVPGAHDVIGDRAYGEAPGKIAVLGRAVCDGLLDEGVLPVIKHIPGHGRALVDSHLSLPVVETSLHDLERSDFAPFRALADQPWAMTAHVVYRAIDDRAPATLSAKVIGEIIRGTIGFEGVLVSDDLSMKALGGSFEERTMSALDAGCDLVLHCNGEQAEMEAIASVLPPMAEVSRERVALAARRKRKAPDFDIAAAQEAIGAIAS